jgi:hypothetical protein
MLKGCSGSLQVFHSLQSRPEVQSPIVRHGGPEVTVAALETKRHDVKPSRSERCADLRRVFTSLPFATRSRR